MFMEYKLHCSFYSSIVLRVTAFCGPVIFNTGYNGNSHSDNSFSDVMKIGTFHTLEYPVKLDLRSCGSSPSER